MNFNENFIIFGSRFVDLLELKNLWRPVFCVYDRLHKYSSTGYSISAIFGIIYKCSRYSQGKALALLQREDVVPYQISNAHRQN